MTHGHELYPTGKIPKGEFCNECARFNSRYIVCNILIIQNKKVLLQKRNIEPFKGKWEICGGYIDWNETIKEAAAREVKEELGYYLEKIEFFKVYDGLKRDPDGRQNISHCFITHVTKDPPRIDPNEVGGFAWFNLENLPDNIGFDHEKMINDFKRSIEQNL